MPGGVKQLKKRERANSILMLIASGMLVWLLIILFASLTSPKIIASLQYVSSQSGQITLLDFLLSLLIALFILYLVRRRHIFGTLVAMILSFLIFGGAAIYFSVELAFFLAMGLLIYERMYRSFISNNVFILAAVLFGSLPIGLGYSVELIIMVLIIISVYDVLGVFATRFIPRLAATAVEQNVPLLLLAPRAHIAWKAKPNLKDSSAMLGAGDLFLPGIFIAAVSFSHTIPVALAVLAGAIIGGLINTILATVIKTGIPAMPMLAAGMIIGYFLSI
ncbi:hypothetical protein KJ611_03400 [Patescibacteria group bacterium]|nr:hypothetical protein [Patescibacteria group bacterium]MBU1705608.1 hypothetical protein [Patescibacteria group bacterium]